MKQLKKLSENENYTAVNLGSLDELMDYSLIHPVRKTLIEGKVFLKDATDATGQKFRLTCYLPKLSSLISIFTGKTKKLTLS